MRKGGEAGMSRLIDADALNAAMYHEAFETDTDMQKWDSGCWIRYKMFERAIKAAPTIDAVPVKHGKWEKAGVLLEDKNNRYLFEEVDGYQCSQCGQQTLRPFYFCPRCGAKMDEVTE